MSTLNPGLFAATRILRTMINTNTANRSSESLMALHEALQAIIDEMVDEGSSCRHMPWESCECRSEEATI